MWKCSALLVIFLSATAVAHAQDVVQLRNGKSISGTVIVDEQKSSEGFWMKSLTTGGMIFIKWSQVPLREKHRLVEKPASATTEMIDGIRIVTKSSRFVLGAFVDNSGALMESVPDSISGLPSTIHVKVASAPRPVLVPRSAVDMYARVRIRESDAFSKEEMVARREAKVDSTDVKALWNLAEYAKGLGLYEKAKSLWQSVAQLDPSRQADVDSRVASLDRLISEAGARAALAALLNLAQKGKFAEALEAADRFMEDFGETETAGENPDLVAQIEKEKETYEKNRGAYLVAKVPTAWRSLRKSLLAEYAKKKYKCAEARNKISSLDQEIQDKLTEQFNCSPEDLLEAWEKRELKKLTVKMGDLSWLYQPGGNGGEIDYQGGGEEEGLEEDPTDDFVKRFGGRQKGQGKNQKKNDPGKKLKTADEVWISAGTSKRKYFLTAEYAMTSANVKIIKKVEKKCSSCRGEGTKKAKRNGASVQVLCDKCHGGTVEFTVTFD